MVIPLYMNRYNTSNYNDIDIYQVVFCSLFMECNTLSSTCIWAKKDKCDMKSVILSDKGTCDKPIYEIIDGLVDIDGDPAYEPKYGEW